MSRVIQCDGCKEVMGFHSAPYEITMIVAKGEDTVASISTEHACDKACVRKIINAALERVDRSR